MEGVWSSTLAKLLGGFRMWQFTGDMQKRVKVDQLVVILQKEHFDLFRRVALAVQEHHASANSLMLQGVVAAMFATFDKLPTKADEFWRPVLGGIGLDSQLDARWRLRKLLSSIVESRVKARSDKVSLNKEALFVLCCVAWNRWRKGEKVQALVRPKERPKLM